MIFVLVVTVYGSPLKLWTRSKALALFHSARACEIASVRVRRSWFVDAQCFAVDDTDDSVLERDAAPERDLYGL